MLKRFNFWSFFLSLKCFTATPRWDYFLSFKFPDAELCNVNCFFSWRYLRANFWYYVTGEVGESEIVTEDAAFVRGEPPQDGDGPPKVDSEVEVLHDKVTKQIIKEGHGQKPSKYSTCFCEYLCFHLLLCFKLFNSPLIKILASSFDHNHDLSTFIIIM